MVLPFDCRRAGFEGPRGFTLLEVLVAMTLTAFGILGFMGLLCAVDGIGARDAWAVKAVFCARERMEELSYAVALGETDTCAGTDWVTSGPYEGMARAWSVEAHPAEEGLRWIRVECSYPWKGEQMAFRLSTLVCR